MMSMIAAFGWSYGRGSGLLRVELDDELLAHRDVDLLAQRQIAHGGGRVVRRDLEPLRDLSVQGVDVVADDDHLLRLRTQRDHVALPQRVGRDRHALAVHVDMAVPDELAGLVAARREPGAEHGVVDAQLERAHEVLTGDARLTVRLRVERTELLLEQAVDAARLLLLAQLQQVLAVSHATAAVHARRVRTPLDRAAHGLALGALEEQ